MIPRVLHDLLVSLLHRTEELERRAEYAELRGTIAEVDPEKGLARVKLGDGENGKPYLSPWVPWTETRMGTIKTHNPPSVGETVIIRSASGNLADAYIGGSLPNKQNPRPSKNGGEQVTKVGDDHSSVMTGSDYTHTVGKIAFKKSAGGGARPGAAIS